MNAIHRLLSLCTPWVVGGSLALGAGAIPAIALTEAEVAQKLDSVPAFVLLDPQGSLIVANLVAEAEQGQRIELPVLYVFLDGQDAETFLQDARQDNPEQFGSGAQVSWVELGALYQEAQVEREQPLELAYMVQDDDLAAAQTLNSDYPGGVPVYTAVDTDGSYLLVPENEELVLPVFFSRSDLEALLAEIGEVNPETVADLQVDVLPLESLLAQMENNDTEEFSKIRLVPDSEAIEYIRSRTGQQPTSEQPPTN
ncbi:hypothetical protein IQ241_12175 [Romeria aff. gracilis LEGE 07310]|uniref:Uncharacterized protein n=1 Tax=Vasconcelosia minhoensis LEGE 07310 TaxID=915328 RepID=A0A8J7ADP9_9CYAN|nr:Tic22 family protein [Romeria gracilis]MBE9078041.1 hypothetical protein [Romeria aff. gracilis LEGE 07310]